MEENNTNNNDQIRYVMDSMGARLERTTKRFIIAIIVLIIAIVVNNAAWLYAWMQYDYSSSATTTKTIEVDGKDGIANYIGNTGDINNGKDTSTNSDTSDEN